MSIAAAQAALVLSGCGQQMSQVADLGWSPEVAMFTAQAQISGDEVVRMGMNHESAPENAQFVLNVLHWLSGLLDESP